MWNTVCQYQLQRLADKPYQCLQSVDDLDAIDGTIERLAYLAGVDNQAALIRRHRSELLRELQPEAGSHCGQQVAAFCLLLKSGSSAAVGQLSKDSPAPLIDVSQGQGQLLHPLIDDPAARCQEPKAC
eukprot:scaffold74728_cov33-Prasinocladus_malaysianus.AAC.5